MEHSREHYPEPAWTPAEDAPALKALRTKGIAQVVYPEELEAQRDAWRKSTASRGDESVWVGVFRAITEDNAATHVYFIALGSAERPYLQVKTIEDEDESEGKIVLDSTVLGFTVEEWDAFVGGVTDGEFDI